MSRLALYFLATPGTFSILHYSLQPSARFFMMHVDRSSLKAFWVLGPRVCDWATGVWLTGGPFLRIPTFATLLLILFLVCGCMITMYVYDSWIQLCLRWA